MQNYIFTKDEFISKYGDGSISDEDFSRDIREVCEFVVDHVTANSTINWWNRINDGQLTDFQIENLKKVCMSQFKYELDNGKIRNYSGIDADTGNISSTEELDKKIISPEADKLLHRYGFYYKGLFSY